MKNKNKDKKIRIPEGSVSAGSSLNYILENLKNKGIIEKDYHHVRLEKSYKYCYYESDEPDLEMHWDNIYED